ncbi:MAG: NUDIX hydrolase [Candidatus Micrarchaeota archaeon]|nr:NUDIX hydrolase [Candidatus Micrarchaeota archaeon]MDE1846460.1 NUDIX hydrolase [Candidatus Micrarchaeota archaeon]
MPENKVKRLSEKVLYSNEKGSMKLIETIDIVGGKEIKKRFVREGDSVTIIPLLGDNRIVMLRNYRAAGLRKGSEEDAFSYELPSGHINDGEDPMAAVRRELKEETGFSVSDVEPLMSHYIGLYITALKDHVFVARGLEEGRTRLEDDESITWEAVKVSELRELLRNGTIKDASSRDALFHWLAFGK